ncbi:hypothetical protein [Brachybacterium sp. GPGPB12]
MSWAERMGGPSEGMRPGTRGGQVRRGQGRAPRSALETEDDLEAVDAQGD